MPKRLFNAPASSFLLALAFLATPRSAHAEGYVYFTQRGAFETGSPRAGAVDAGSSVYVADERNYCTQKFANCGACITQWGTLDTANGVLQYPFVVAVDASGADHSDSKLPEATTPPSVPQVAGEPPAEPSPEILKACRRINPESLLRVRGDFGQFQGYASQVGPQGLDGLRAHPTDGSFASPTGLVTWDRIDRIEKRVGSSGWSALVGALVLGGIGAYFGALWENWEPSGHPPVHGAVTGAAAGGAIGAGLGALIGTAIPRWHVAYEAVRLPGAPPTIVAITPLNQTVSAGANAAITVTATGAEPLAYRWFRNGLPLAERNSPTIALAPAQANDSGTYFCVVTNGFGTATSAVAILSVTAAEE